MEKDTNLKKIKKYFNRAQRAKHAGKKKKAIKEFNRAINLYLKKLRDYGNSNKERV